LGFREDSADVLSVLELRQFCDVVVDDDGEEEVERY